MFIDDPMNGVRKEATEATIKAGRWLGSSRLEAA
jgi:hypothetical protein